MRIPVLILLTLFIGFGSASAQLTKAERKAIKKEIKGYKKDPEAYVKMIEDYEETVEELEGEVEGLVSKVKGMQSQLAVQADTIAALRMRLAQAIANQSADMRELPPGRAYQIQVGAYEVFSIKEFLEQDRYMSYEFDEGMEKYVIGYFTDVTEAESLRDELIKMGINDAFVVRYEDGSRIGPEDTAGE